MSKAYQREGDFASVQLKPVIFTLLRCTSAECSSPAAAALWRRSGAAANGPGTTIKYLQRTTSGAADNGLGTTIKYLQRATRQRPGQHDQVPAMHSEATMRSSAASTCFTTRLRMASTFPRGIFLPRASWVGAVRASPLGLHFCSENLLNQNAGAGSTWAKAHYIKAPHELC